MIADDHALVRRGLRQVLDAGEGIEVIAEATDLAGARRYARRHHPRVLVLDLNLPDGMSLEPIPEIRSERPDTQIVVLTMQNEPTDGLAQREVEVPTIRSELVHYALDGAIGDKSAPACLFHVSLRLSSLCDFDATGVSRPSAVASLAPW